MAQHTHHSHDHEHHGPGAKAASANDVKDPVCSITVAPYTAKHRHSQQAQREEARGVTGGTKRPQRHPGLMSVLGQEPPEPVASFPGIDVSFDQLKTLKTAALRDSNRVPNKVLSPIASSAVAYRNAP